MRALSHLSAPLFVIFSVFAFNPGINSPAPFQDRDKIEVTVKNNDWNPVCVWLQFPRKRIACVDVGTKTAYLSRRDFREEGRNAFVVDYASNSRGINGSRGFVIDGINVERFDPLDPTVVGIAIEVQRGLENSTVHAVRVKMRRVP